MQLKRILAGAMATLTAGATLMFGAFGAGLGDFVQVSDSSLASPIIVVGDAAPAPDIIGATNIGVAVAGYATTTRVIAGSSAQASVTNGALVSSDLNKSYINQNLRLVKQSMTSDDLPTVLAGSAFTDLNATEVTIQNLLDLGSLGVNYTKPTADFDEPILNMPMTSNNKYNLTIMFLGGLDPHSVDSSTSISILGSQFTFGPSGTSCVASSACKAAPVVTLYSSGGAETVSLEVGGDPQTVTIDGTEYTFEMYAYASGTPNGAYIKVNGAATSPTLWNAGSTYTIPGTTTKVLVNSVNILNLGGSQGGSVTASAELFIGSNKIVLEQGQNVVKNDEAMVNSIVEISNSSTKINSITITSAPDLDEYVTDTAVADPVFGSFKWVVDGMTPTEMSAGRDYIKVAGSGNTVKLTFTNLDSAEGELSIAYWDSGTSAFTRGDGSRDLVITEINESQDPDLFYNVDRSDYFVVSKAGTLRTNILRYNSISTSDKYVTLTDAFSGTQYKVYYQSDPYIRIGTDTFQINVSETGQYPMAVDLDGDGTMATEANSTVSLYTKGRAVINIAGDGVEITENPLFTITGSNDPSGYMLNVTYDYSSSTMQINSNRTGVQVGTTDERRLITPYGSYITYDTEAEVFEMYNPGDRPAYVNVAVGTDPTITVGGGGVGGTFQEAVKITSPVAKLASEVSESLTADAIFVGGPCAISLVATLMAQDNITCANFGNNYNVGVIKEYANAFGSGKKALVVAGWTAADTRSLAARVMQGTTSYSA
jgi:hypothetical protein